MLAQPMLIIAFMFFLSLLLANSISSKKHVFSQLISEINQDVSYNQWHLITIVAECYINQDATYNR